MRLETVTFCGGEVFSLPYFTGLVNKLTSSEVILVSPDLGAHPGSPEDSGHTSFARMTNKIDSLDTKTSGIFVQIITNGTIDKLSEFENPNMVNLIVSIDGLRDYHDKNRGDGNFDKSIKFLQKARKLGFHTEIFSIVTKQNIGRIDEFEEYINTVLTRHSGKPEAHPESVGDSGQAGITRDRIGVTYHPRKPPSYLLHHPISNIRGVTDGFDFLDRDELIQLMKERQTFPPKDFGCFQIALASDGKVYGCCEGTKPIGNIDDKIELLFTNLGKRLEIWEKENPPVSGLRKCLGCSQPDFVCGIHRVILGSPD